MKMFPLPESKAWNIAFSALFFCVLCFARDTMISMSKVGITNSIIISIFLFFVAVCTFLFVNRKKFRSILLDYRMLLAVATAFFLLGPMIVKCDWQLMYISIFICACFGLFLTYFKSFNEVAKLYVWILVILAVYSLITTYFCKMIMREAGELFVPVFKNPADFEFLDFGISFAPRIWKNNRNYGMFREPGVYQFFIIIALFIANFKIDFSKKRYLWSVNAVLSITMLTTASTNGVLELVMFFALIFIDKGYHKKRWFVITAVACSVCLILLCFYSWTSRSLLYRYMDQLVGKLFRKSMSLTHRVDAIVADVNIFLKYPLFGGKLAEVLHAVIDNTTSTLIIFAGYGITTGIFHVVGWIVMIWENKRNVLVNMGLVIVLFMSFNTQNLTWDIMFWLFPMMALTEKVVPWLEEKFPRKC